MKIENKNDKITLIFLTLLIIVYIYLMVITTISGGWEFLRVIGLVWGFGIGGALIIQQTMKFLWYLSERGDKNKNK